MAREEQKKDTERTAIIPSNIVTEMKDSYLDYAMSVIVARALPDVRDGLKPVHRRILFSMHDIGLTATAKFKKSATIVGDVLGKYHPHGDSSVYDAMVKLAQDFSSRYPLVLGQGNFGSIDGDSAAAYRYTEAKMSRLAAEMLRDIEKETVDFTPNFDATRKEPVVFPSALPNLLLNGSMGIAVGMATKIPPHNLTEVMDALLHLADNPEATTEDLLEFVKGPDFPLGGLVFNEHDIRSAYTTGKGGVLTRGYAEIVEGSARGESFDIIITSLPYQVNKAELIVKMADLVHEKKIEGIKDIRDESTKDIRVVVSLKGGINPQKVLNALYKHTDLETMFHYNMLALVDGVPELLSLKDMLQNFLEHRKEIVTRRTRYDLRKAEEREHILLGLKKALDHIDEIIQLIKKSKDTAEAHAKLCSRFKFSDLQAAAILEMKLSRLAGLERKRIEDELKSVQALIEELRELLNNPKKLLALIKSECKEIREKYGDARRTAVVRQGVSEITDEDLVPEKESMLTLTSGGYVKRTDPTEYKSQRRGGVGVVDLNTKEEDFVTTFLTTNTHSDLLFFSNRGKAYQTKMYEIPEGRRATRGKSIMNFLSLSDDEQITSVLAFPKELKTSRLFLMMVTKQGVVKKVSAESFKDVRRSGLIAIKLASGDLLHSALLVNGGDTVLLSSKKGQAIRFKESDVREMGRTAGGVRAMLLKRSDEVVSAGTVSKGGESAAYLSVSESGFGKRTPVREYKIQKRGGSGIKTMKLTTKTGDLISSRVVGETDEELVAISKHGQVIRTAIKEIPTHGRQTQGVRIMKLREGDSLASLTFL